MPVLQPGGAVAAQRALRDRRAVQAQGPQGRRHGARHDARGVRHGPRRQHRALLPRPAADPLPLPDQGARRAATARRRPAHARVHHEGRLHLRPRPRRALDESYEQHVAARTTGSSTAPGSSGTSVESDVGMMGGMGAHEYMAPCPAGENDVALAPGYAANVEVACADAQPVELPAPLPAPELSDTPGMVTVAAVARRARRAGGRAAEGVPGDRRGRRAEARHAARRPPRQRDQAPERARRRVPARARRGVRVRDRAGRLHRAGRGATCRSCSTPAWRRAAT